QKRNGLYVAARGLRPDVSRPGWKWRCRLRDTVKILPQGVEGRLPPLPEGAERGTPAHIGERPVLGDGPELPFIGGLDGRIGSGGAVLDFGLAVSGPPGEIALIERGLRSAAFGSGEVLAG